MISFRLENIMKLISLVIPCYGSERTLVDVVMEIQKVFQDISYDYEIILINDYSPDNVWNIIAQLSEANSNIIGINMARNFGQHAALMAGYREASGDVVVSLDDDGQAPVEEIPELLKKIEDGYDLVYGKYPKIKQDKFRIFGSYINDKMTEIMLGKPENIRVTSFFAARKFVIEEMIKYEKSYPYVIGLALRSTQNIANILVEQRQRTEGKSGYTFRKLLSLWLNGFTAFSVKPLRIATFSGTLCAFIGFLYGIYIIIQKLINPAVLIGYSSIMSIILLIGGVIMLLLGMIGEYVGRIYVSVNNAPQYVIREKIGGSYKNET